MSGYSRRAFGSWVSQTYQLHHLRRRQPNVEKGKTISEHSFFAVEDRVGELQDGQTPPLQETVHRYLELVKSPSKADDLRAFHQQDGHAEVGLQVAVASLQPEAVVEVDVVYEPQAEQADCEEGCQRDAARQLPVLSVWKAFCDLPVAKYCLQLDSLSLVWNQHDAD